MRAVYVRVNCVGYFSVFVGIDVERCFHGDFSFSPRRADRTAYFLISAYDDDFPTLFYACFCEMLYFFADFPIVVIRGFVLLVSFSCFRPYTASVPFVNLEKGFSAMGKVTDYGSYRPSYFVDVVDNVQNVTTEDDIIISPVQGIFAFGDVVRVVCHVFRPHA